MNLLILIKIILGMALVCGIFDIISERAWRYSYITVVARFLIGFSFGLIVSTILVGSTFFILQVH